MTRFLPSAVTLMVLAAGVPLAWMGATPITSGCDELVARSEELSQLSSSTSLWPPGVHCVSRGPDGRQLETTYVTWYELAVVVILAVMVWLTVAALMGGITIRALGVGAVAMSGVLLAVSVAFFV